MTACGLLFAIAVGVVPSAWGGPILRSGSGDPADSYVPESGGGGPIGK